MLGGTSTVGSPRSAVPFVLLLLILSTLVWTPAGGLPTPDPSVGIEPGPSDARTPSLAVDASGDLHLVRSDDLSGERGVYYTRSTNGGASWTAGVRIDTPGTPAYYPRIAVEREPVPIRGRLYVAYQTGTGTSADVWFTLSDGGGVWTAPRRIDLGPLSVASQFPAIAASDARAYASWSDNRLDSTSYQLYVRSSADGSATWGPEIQLSLGGISNLQSRMDAKGATAVVVWRYADPTGTSIRLGRTDDGGATWRQSAAFQGATPSDNPRDPEVYLDELGVAHVVWALQTPTGEQHIWYARSGDGLTWTPPVRVDDFAGFVQMGMPSVTGLAGTLWVAWHDSRSGDADIYASWSTDGVAWGAIGANNDLRVDDTDRNGVSTDDSTTQQTATVRSSGWGVFAAWEDLRSIVNPDIYFGTVQVSPLVITEIQDEPASEARVEIYNFRRTAFSVAGATMTAGATVVDLSPLGSIAGRAHVVVGAAAGSDLQVPLDLGTEGARVQIVQGADVLATAASGLYGIAPDPLAGESTARYAGTIDYTTAWTRATSRSFRSRNLVPVPNAAPSVVLNEVLFNPSAPGERFVELMLRGIATVDLTGYRLVADAESVLSGSLGAANPYTFVLEGRIPAWFVPLDAGGDSVYLYDAGGRLLDMVGWTSPHTAGTSVARVPEGAGGLLGYDEPTDAANGWVFDRTPSLQLIRLVSDQRQMADVGTIVTFPLTATNAQSVAEYVNVAYSTVTPWPVSFTWPSGTPLTDSLGDPDSLPDLGAVAPGASVPFLAEVTVPIEGQIGHGNLVDVSVIAASLPVARDNVTLAVDLYPHFDVTRDVAPSPVYLEGTGPPWNEVSQITVSVMGAGLPIVQEIPIDVVWQIDTSGSMITNDPFNLRVDAVNAFIDTMRVDDRGAVVGFNDIAWVVNNRPLTFTDAMGKQTLKGDANTTRFANGGTNIDAALLVANNLLIAEGNRSRPRIEILLTDGQCVPPCTNTNNLVNQAAAEGIVIYTIGLGSGVNEAFLTSIATGTGGRYYYATTAQDLLPIYLEIGLRINRTAGIDPNPWDSVPMIEDHIAPYLTVIPNSFYDPATGFPRDPSWIQQFGDRTRIQWNVARIDINETWSVRFSVTSTRLGVQDVALHPDARVSYLRWDGSTVFQPIPQGTLEVLRAPSPPEITATVPADGAVDVAVDQSILATFSQPMDTATVQWTISPPVSVAPTWVAQSLRLDHGGLAECTRYTVDVTQGFDLDGEALVPGPVPNPWSFHTVCPLRVAYTFTRVPLYGNVTVDGKDYLAPWTFVWLANETHEVEVPNPDPYGGSRLVFGNWTDGGARVHSVFVGMVDATITAAFALQHPAGLTLVGLTLRNPVNVTFRQGAPGQAARFDAWSGWVDDGSDVAVDQSIPGIPGERFLTRDEWRWTVRAPLARTVRYDHQYVATIRLVGLLENVVGVTFHSFGGTDRADVRDAWTAWVDAGRQLRVEASLDLGARERFRTFDPTQWTVDTPLDKTVGYLHQFRPRVTLVGLGGNDTVGATWREDAQPAQAGGLVDELYRWADAGTVLRFDEQSEGSPPKFALDPTSFEVTYAFDATIRYALAPPPPPENWKPVLALAYTIGLLAVGGAASRRLIDHYVPVPVGGTRVGRRKAWKGLPVGQKISQLTIREIDLKVHRDQRFTRLALLLPFAGVEGAIGLLSHLTGILRIPEAGQWLPLGFWLNTVLLSAGVAASLAVWRRGYRITDEALLKLAEVRARAAGVGSSSQSDGGSAAGGREGATPPGAV